MTRREVTLNIRKLPLPDLTASVEMVGRLIFWPLNKEQRTAKHPVEEKTAIGFTWGGRRGAMLKKFSNHFFLL